MALVRSLILFGAAAFAAAGAHAEALRALGSCPKTMRECVEMRMHWDFARTDKPTFDAKGAIAVRGRLGDGEAQAFQLSLAAPEGGLDLGDVAYLGRAKDGLPKILTDRGAFVVETRGVHVGRGSAVVLVNTRSKTLKREYLGGLSGATFVIASADKVGVMTKSGTCLAPPTARPGPLKAVAVCGSVARTPLAGFSERVAGAIAPAPDADLALIRKLLPQTAEFDDETLRLKIGRIDKNTLVVTPW
jgi:hypothetical protein